MKWYIIHTGFGATGAVSVSKGRITNEYTAPIFGKFIGQRFSRLRNWNSVIKVEGPFRS